MIHYFNWNISNVRFEVEMVIKKAMEKDRVEAMTILFFFFLSFFERTYKTFHDFGR